MTSKTRPRKRNLTLLTKGDRFLQKQILHLGGFEGTPVLMQDNATLPEELGETSAINIKFNRYSIRIRAEAM